MKSNITLYSNIYVNKTTCQNDKDFLRHIVDYHVLKKLKTASLCFGISDDTWMAPVQREILRQGQSDCSYEKGTKSWGVPIGEDHLHCRCEQNDCSHFSRCKKLRNFDAIQRKDIERQPAPAKEKTSPLPLYLGEGNEQYESVGETICDSLAKLERVIIPDIHHGTELEDAPVVAEQELDPIRASEPVVKAELKVAEQKQDSASVSEPVVKTELKVADSSNNDVQIVSQATIINASTEERIWVNAGPGTGKTYIVIQRLLTLLEKGFESPILILCFSKNAVQVIRERLSEKLGHHADALLDDSRLVIRTFDSFASYMLKDDLDTVWDYDRRIEEFIRMLSRNCGALDDMFGYLIVDEIQDTVGVRARMLLAMLNELSCGALLLGDRCQAIFDWTIRDTDDITFNALAKGLLEKHFKCYELKGNRRQEKVLATMGQQLREKMLADDETSQEAAVAEFKKCARSMWRSYDIKALPQLLSGSDELILTQTNGEAAYISQCLFDAAAQVNHVMRQSTGHRTLSPWIAKILNGNDGHYMAKEAFIQNAKDYEILDAEGKWTSLKSLDGHRHAPVLHITEVLTALAKKDGLPESCLNQYENCAVVSTVHRAKGSEADHVYWLDGPLLYDSQEGEEGALSDALRAAYVAATRAKKDIHLLDQKGKVCMKKAKKSRWIQIGWSKSKSKNPYCKGIALLPEDTDETSFAAGGCAEGTQTVLSCIERGMQVSLFPNESLRRFEIFFDGQRIGTTSSTFTEALFAAFEATNHNTNWPSSIPNVYISAVTTVVAPGSAGVNEQYATSGCWLGIELGGFPMIEWY